MTIRKRLETILVEMRCHLEVPAVLTVNLL